jgi:capsid assembly protease
MSHAGLWALRSEFLSAADQQHIAETRSKMTDRGTVAAASVDWLAPDSFATIQEGVVVIPLRGALMNYMSWWAWSYEELARDLDLAANDERVQRAVLYIDSPGGLVAGTDTAGAAIRAFKEIKPITAMINGRGLSAAYWIACATGEVIATSRSEIGSVGAMKRGIDFEPIMIKAGAELIEVVAKQSPNKALAPNSPEGQAEMQAIVDHAGGQFVADLARFRGIAEAEVLKNFGQGLVFHAEEALSRGMVDAIDLAANVISPDWTGGAAAETEGPDAVTVPDTMEVRGMTLKPNSSGGPADSTAAAPLTPADLDAAVAKATAAAEANFRSQLEADRKRIAALDDLGAKAGAGATAIIAAAKTDGTSAADAALAIFAAGAHIEGAKTAAIAADEALAVGAKPAAPASGTKASTPEGWKAEYEGSAALKAEFPTAEAYVAFMKSEAKKGGAL